MLLPQFKSLPPLSLYIHVPWCIKKCPYCDFNSHQLTTPLPEEDYIKALLTDFRQDLEYIQGRTLHSIFIGGGTPSLFSASSFEILLHELEKLIHFDQQIEITLEANPGTAEQDKFRGYHQAGINRLSIGVQSFNSQHLQSLGRIHNAEEAQRAAKIAQQSGFKNFNLDFMFGLPRQNTEQALADLKRAVSLKPTHLSWYQLTIEPNTEFYSQAPNLPHEECIDEMEQAGQDYLANAGYKQYEISAYSQPGYESQHNLNYWQFGDYIGIGAGAHGKVTQADQKQIIRTRKSRQPKHYLDKNNSFLVEESVIRPSEIPLEFMLNALRLVEGLDQKYFTERTGLAINVVDKQIKKAQQKGLLITHNNRLQATQKGLQFLNDTVAIFQEYEKG